MSLTLADLMGHPTFGLRLLIGVPDDIARTPVSWVHGSDLVDPTPWLESGQVLLTDGANIGTADPDGTRAYVARLVGAGIIALGFAVGVIHDEVPEDLIEACSELGLPIFEVPRATPFMAIIRLVADDIGRDRALLTEASLEAHRAVARAALRPDGLVGILRELEKQLGSWVALYDPNGVQRARRATSAMPASARAAVETEVGVALARGSRTARRVIDSGGEFTLQTLGRSGHLNGVLVVGESADGSIADDDLVTSVLAMASISLDHNRVLETARADLNAGIWEMLLGGAVDAASRAAGRSGFPLPAAPVRVLRSRGRSDVESLLAELTPLIGRSRRPLFVLRRGDELTVVVSADQSGTVTAAAERAGARAGVSLATSWGALEAAVSQADAARARFPDAAKTGTVNHFDDALTAGVLGLIDRRAGVDLARARLAPLLDADDGTVLIREVTVWLRHNGAGKPAAAELNLHRHTLSAHLVRLAGLLDIDLDDFSARAELWAALMLLERSDTVSTG